MAHRSCFSGFIIDFQTGQTDEVATFWSAALGCSVIDRADRFHTLDPVFGLNIEVRAVEPRSHVHLDMQTDDIPAQALRLRKLSARAQTKKDRGRVIKEPSGHRFCLARDHSDDFEMRMTLWEDE